MENMLSDNVLKIMIEKRVREVEEIYAQKFDVSCHCSILFNIRGTSCGGRASGYERRVRFNLDWARVDLQEYLREVVPHEVGHVITYLNFGDGHGHDSYWQHVVRSFGIKPERCAMGGHFNDARPARRTRKFSYVLPCGCKFEMSGVLHKRISNGQNRICRKHRTRILPEHTNGVGVLS